MKRNEALDPARGVINAVLLSIPLWAAILYTVRLFIGG